MLRGAPPVIAVSYAEWPQRCVKWFTFDAPPWLTVAVLARETRNLSLAMIAMLRCRRFDACSIQGHKPCLAVLGRRIENDVCSLPTESTRFCCHAWICCPGWCGLQSTPASV
jgi:hypothetical protein